MKIIDVLNKIADGTLEDGFEFEYLGNLYIYDKRTENIYDKRFIGSTEYRLGEFLVLEKCLNDEIEVIEKTDNVHSQISCEEAVLITVKKFNEEINKLNEFLEKENKKEEM